MGKIQRYAPDTNFYLHAKAPDQIPWADVTDAETIELIVLDEVLRELDRHKATGNGRLSRRARKIFTTIDPLIDDDEEEVEARKDKPRVVWRLAPLLAIDRNRPAGLDLTSADGRIIEEALAVREVLGGELSLLTHDRLPRRLATTVGLDRQRVPDEWLLPPEPDERDKQNAKLKEELDAWRRRAPVIELELLESDEPIKQIQGTLVRYRLLSDEFVSDAVWMIENRHPEESNNIEGAITIVSQAAISKYHNERREWLENVKERLEKQPARFSLVEGMLELSLEVGNTGSAPADGFVLDVTVEGSVRLVNDRKWKEFRPNLQVMGLPRPPKLERNPFRQDPFGLADVGRLHTFDHIKPLPRPRDPNGFYWDYPDDTLFCSSVKGTCEDFRHQDGTISLPFILAMPFEDEGDPVGCLRIRCSARNIPTSLTREFPIRLGYDWRDCEEQVRRLVIGE